MPRQIILDIDELKKMKLNENQLKLVVYLIDYFSEHEKQKPRGLITLREKCEYLLGYRLKT
jgi:hypothetical protein|tara:strand:- start:1313 stop:1495 length:183 start_codon:yes stop_codon:yes gene_type:complete